MLGVVVEEAFFSRLGTWIGRRLGTYDMWPWAPWTSSLVIRFFTNGSADMHPTTTIIQILVQFLILSSFSLESRLGSRFVGEFMPCEARRISIILYYTRKRIGNVVVEWRRVVHDLDDLDDGQ